MIFARNLQQMSAARSVLRMEAHNGIQKWVELLHVLPSEDQSLQLIMHTVREDVGELPSRAWAQRIRDRDHIKPARSSSTNTE